MAALVSRSLLFALLLVVAPSTPAHANKGNLGKGGAPALGRLGKKQALGKTTRCRRDADCVVCPRRCRGCGPCKPRWRTACNRRHAASVLAQRKGGCPKVKCKRCPTVSDHPRHRRWLGNYAFCQRGLCRLRHFAHPLPFRPKSPDRACKRDAQCTLMPLVDPCECPPCGHVWRRAVNKAAYRRWKGKWAARRCRQRPCPSCATVAYGRSARCIAGQCTVRP